MFIEANLKKNKIDYVDLYRPDWGDSQQQLCGKRGTYDVFPQLMLVHVRGKSHCPKQMLLIGLICSPVLSLLYSVFIEKTMSITEPVKGGVYNILLLGMVVICLPSLLVTSITYLHLSFARRWFFVSQGELIFLDIPKLFGYDGIYTKSFCWEDILQIEFIKDTNYICVWDILKWNPVWPVPNWTIHIKVKEYHWSEYIKPNKRENAYNSSLSLGSISEKDIQELCALFLAFIPDNVVPIKNNETAYHSS